MLISTPTLLDYFYTKLEQIVLSNTWITQQAPFQAIIDGKEEIGKMLNIL